MKKKTESYCVYCTASNEHCHTKPQLHIAVIDHGAKLPQYAHPGDSGMDIYSLDSCALQPHTWDCLLTGFSIAVPEGYEAQIRPKSGMAQRHGVTVLNTPGTIDSGYRGELGVILMNHSDKIYHITRHQKIAQLVICPVAHPEILVVDHLDDTERGSGGFGSTGDV